MHRTVLGKGTRNSKLETIFAATMKISLNWLRSLNDVQESTQEIADALSVSGLEVEHLETFSSVKGGLKGIVIGQVLTCIKHPNADKLSVTTVDIGLGEPQPIVCGAPNVAAGQKVLVATVGTQILIPGKEPFTIGEAKIRGEVSRGMICAEDEIGLGNSHDGILVLPEDAPIGEKAETYFNIYVDEVLEIGLTANRGDAASHLGVARDVAALFNSNTSLPNLKNIASNNYAPASKKIDIVDSNLCKRYVAVEIKNVKNGPSPDWIKNRLKSIDIEPKNLLVDVTNYVLHEMGQPIHAFDLDKLGNDITIRSSRLGEKLTLLDSKEIELNEHSIVISSDDKPIALAGVYGGKDSGVTENTTNVLIESANFNSVNIRKTAKKYNLNTDASFRFERETDITICSASAMRVADLILEYGGGEITGVTDLFPTPFEPKIVQLTWKKLKVISGAEIPKENAIEILNKLGFETTENSEGIEVKIPGYKNDCELDIDLIEEIMRIYGYDNIPFTGSMKVSLSDFSGLHIRNQENKARQTLTALGFLEIENNSLISEENCKLVSAIEPIVLTNPLSTDMNAMRTSMLPGMVSSIAYNRNRKNNNTHFFEFGRIYTKENGETVEKNRLAIAMAGNIDNESWEAQNKSVTATDLRKAILQLLQQCGIKKTKEFDVVTVVSPKLMKHFDAGKGEIWYAELDWDKILEATKNKNFKVVAAPKFPWMRRDLSLVLKDEVNYESIEKVIRKAQLKLLKKHTLFDVYRGENIDQDSKALAIAFYFGAEDRTLTDVDTDAEMNILMLGFEKELSATIRR